MHYTKNYNFRKSDLVCLESEKVSLLQKFCYRNSALLQSKWDKDMLCLLYIYDYCYPKVVPWSRDLPTLWPLYTCGAATDLFNPLHYLNQGWQHILIVYHWLYFPARLPNCLSKMWVGIWEGLGEPVPKNICKPKS